MGLFIFGAFIQSVPLRLYPARAGRVPVQVTKPQRAGQSQASAAGTRHRTERPGTGVPVARTPARPLGAPSPTPAAPGALRSVPRGSGTTVPGARAGEGTGLPRPAQPGPPAAPGDAAQSSGTDLGGQGW